MRLSSMTDYAVVALSAAARHCGSRALSGGRFSAADLAEETGLPVPTVQKLVSILARAGLINSTRGAGGGIALARPAAAISLTEIVEAVEGPIALTICVDEKGHDCALEAQCSVRPHWPIVNEALRGALSEISLARLAQTPEKLEITA